MEYTAEIVEQLIRGGENSSVEFKSSAVRSESIVREISAFANANGGVIMVGVEDSGAVTGIGSEKQNDEEWSVNVARNNITPAIIVDVSFVHLDDKKILCIDVPKGDDKPYQCSDKYYIRVGSTNRIATAGELLRLFQASGVFHFDSTPVSPNSGVASLDATKLERYFEQYNLSYSSETDDGKISLLKNTDIMTSTGDPTVAGMLLFGIHPARVLPQSGVSFAHFSGTEVAAEMIDSQKITGTLDYVIDTTLATIKNNLKRPSIIEGAKRTDCNNTIPDKVLRELIVNACCHRNYSIEGSQIRIFMFDDRIEFISPGRLPNTVTVDKLKYGVSYTSNPVILKFLENMRYVDRLGRGLPMVWNEMNNIGGSVEFEELGESFKVVIRTTA